MSYSPILLAECCESASSTICLLLDKPNRLTPSDRDTDCFGICNGAKSIAFIVMLVLGCNSGESDL